jgi:hypothetical protein
LLASVQAALASLFESFGQFRPASFDAIPTATENFTMQPKLLLPALFAAALIAVSPFSSNGAEQVAPDDHSAEFKTLDNDFARLDKLYMEYTDPVHKLTILGYISLMKDRAEILGWKRNDGGSSRGRGGRGGGGLYDVATPEAKIEFDQVKYEELRYDINLQCQRLANWMAPLRTPPPGPQSERSIEFQVSKLNPNPTNQAEVRAALDVLDREIKKMEERSSSMTSGSTNREAEAARVGRIKERRAALGKEFTKARWDALVGDLKP